MAVSPYPATVSLGRPGALVTVSLAPSGGRIDELTARETSPGLAGHRLRPWVWPSMMEGLAMMSSSDPDGEARPTTVSRVGACPPPLLPAAAEPVATVIVACG